jgi:hypothetical protein
VQTTFLLKYVPDFTSSCQLLRSLVGAQMAHPSRLCTRTSKTFSELPLVEIQPGFWERAGALRAKVLAKHRKARLGDALIAQSCLDAGIPPLTGDRDFRGFAGAAGLTLLVDSSR